MRALRSLLAGAALGVIASVSPVGASEDVPHPPEQHWHSSGIFGTIDVAAAQRGFQVYKEVCANCHSMKLLSYRHLSGIGLNEAQIKAVAASVTVPLGTNDAGEPTEGPGLPSSRFRSPFPNDKAARVANNGALPPDLSVMIRAREGGANYVFALLTGYADAPASVKLGAGMSYNKYFPGHQIGMPKPLNDDQVTYADGTKASTEQMARDVTEFLTWAASPEMTERKQIGVRVILFLILLTFVTYIAKRKVWADVH